MKDNKQLTNHEEYTPKKEDFVLVQKDDKIYDQKMETKTTTFARDAFKRFCKNKSSVVGAIIIGFIMILSIIVPWVSPYNIDVPDPNQSLLTPKLFEAGTGFWDGTKKYENIIFNPNTKTPEGFKSNAIIDGTLKVSTGKTNITNADQSAYFDSTTGGYYRLIAEPRDPGTTEYDKPKRLENRKTFTATADGGFYVDISFGNVPTIQDENITSKQSAYRVSLVYGDEGASSKNKIEIAEIQGWTNSFEPIHFDISQALKNHPNHYESLDKLSVRIQIKREIGEYSHILIESIKFGATNVDAETEALLNEISLTDPCKTFFMKQDELNNFPNGYYSNSGLAGVYQADLSIASFTYDVYEAQMGHMTNFSIGKSDMDSYIEKGWVEYDYNVGPESFKKLSDKSPVDSVTSQNITEVHGENVITLKGDVTLYKYKGYDKMPLYLLGTTDNGYDLIKLSFVALRTSLLIAIISSAICLIFGLCWGSISGYFGGNVDLIMERISDILANIPFIVVMTLIILVLGNNVFTFALALCLTSWIGVAARTRTQFYRFKGREYILASRTLGASDGRLIFKHILPNALGTIVTSSVLMIPSVIFSEASISYLGLGLQGVKSFGVILSENQQYLSSFPSLIVFPAIIISLLMISFNLFGNGLRDALNPSLKGSE